MSPSSVVIADVPTRPGLPVQSTLRLETDMPDRFKKGAQYVFTIELLDPDAFTVGRVLEATQPQ